MTDNLESRLHPDHLTDPRKSGLSDETILEAGIKSVTPGDIDKIFGYPTYAKSAYEIPYPGTDYSRFKMFYDDSGKINSLGEERPKYLARKDSGNRLYIPVKARPFLKAVSINKGSNLIERMLYFSHEERGCFTPAKVFRRVGTT